MSVKTCSYYERCGGCSQQTTDYERQLVNKENMVKSLFAEARIDDYNYRGIRPSPQVYEYRNKMEFSFGDLEIGGTLQLGMHPRGRMYEVLTVDDCVLVDSDFRQVLTAVVEYFREQGFKKYHVKKREGYLRNLIIRKGLNTGEILVNLVTTSQRDHDLSRLAEILNKIDFRGELAGFLHTINDNYSDAVKCDELNVISGKDHFYEELLDCRFKVRPFSFFQVNTEGAEVLYSLIRDQIKGEDKTIYDLYCGTGSIGITLADKAEKITGIEQMAEAVITARENAEINGCYNCEFITGDVLDHIDEIGSQADTIIIDPPRPGIHPEAREKII
ncbi:MAG: 23S rRNA (uracil(1939)-C(5))-methyltransferase RlmD, partial [Halanaerobiales bacterium]